jgi:glycolate oxidase iron-sulfur subunit
VVIPRTQTCCGAIHYHSGAEAPAVARALQNAKAIDVDQVDAIIVNVAGCGAMLKDYGHLQVPPGDRDRIQKFASKVRDISEFLVELGPVPPTGSMPIRATYHDACHLCHAQQVRNQPRELLKLIPGLELVPLEESDICCGAAGTYNLTETEMAERLVERKTRHIESTTAQALFAANAGCLLHITRRLRQDGKELWTGHPIEALDKSYRGEPLQD